MKTFDELIEAEAQRRNSMAGNLALIQRLEFKAGAKFVADNPTMIESVRELDRLFRTLSNQLLDAGDDNYSDVMSDIKLALKNLTKD